MAGNKEAFQKAMNQGHSAAWDQEWEKAADFYGAALEEFPEHPQALSSLGLALFELQDYQTALQCYQKSAAIAPEDPVPMEKMARIYERMGRLNEAVNASLQAAEMHLKARSADKAIDNWVRVLSLQPENVSIRSKLAAVYEKMGRKEDAVAEYIAAASIFQRGGDLTRAMKVIEYANQMMPDNQEVRLALSMLRSNQMLPRASRPKGGTGPMRMANLREMEGKEEAASGEAGGQNDPIAETRQKAMVDMAAMLFDQADEGGSRGGRGASLNALTKGVADGTGEGQDRTRIIMHIGQAIDSQTHGDVNQAVIELEHALDLGLRQPATYFNLGLLLKDSDFDKALRYLQQSVRHPDFALGSHLVMAQVYESNGQLTEAAGAYLQGLSLADAQVVLPEEADELINQYEPLIDAQASVTDTKTLQSVCKSISNQLIRPDWRAYLQKAREHLPVQSEGNPPTPVAEMVLEMRSSQVVEMMAEVRSLAGKGHLRTALEEALYAIQMAPTYLPLHVLIGELLMQDQHTSEAMQKFQVITNLYMVRGETARAIRMLKRMSQMNPSDLGIRQKVIDLLIAQDKIEDALNEYNDLADLYYRLAELDKARQAYLDAIKIAQKSKKNREWGVNLLMKVADIDLQRLNYRQALRIFEQIRTIQPDNAQVRAQIITLNFRIGQDQAAMKDLDEYAALLDSTGRRQQAIDFITDLLIDHSGRHDLRRRLADLYIRSGQVQEAVTQLDTVADAMLSAGKHYEAINMLETIISLRPPNVEEYKSALEGLRRDMLRK